MYSGEDYSALIFGASGGIGAAIAAKLKADSNCTLVTLSRRDDGVDLTDEASVARAANHHVRAGADFDLIINAAGSLEAGGAPPEKAFKEIEAGAMMKSFAVNAVGGAVFLKHFLPLLAKDRRAVFATLSARVGSISDNRLGGWMGYRASKSALNQIIRCAAIETKRTKTNALLVSLHPGTIKTPLTEEYAKGRYTATPEEAAQNLLNVCASLTPAHNGGFFDYAGKEIPW